MAVHVIVSHSSFNRYSLSKRHVLEILLVTVTLDHPHFNFNFLISAILDRCDTIELLTATLHRDSLLTALYSGFF